MRANTLQYSQAASAQNGTLVRSIARAVRRMLRTVGFDLVRYQATASEYPPDFSSVHGSIIRRVQPYTMTSPERLYALMEAVRHISVAGVPGSIVECGVWKGGSMMAAALMLGELKRADVDLYLFDTFEGMPRPKAIDATFEGEPASEIFEALRTGDDSSAYCRAQFQEVQEALASTGYPPERIFMIKGKVEETIPENAPESIALLRLDTDWYESTRHELEHLFPRLSPGGVLIIDDYGHWQGCKRAVDEYFGKNGARIFLARVDYTGRIGVKM
jgi:O-methyltransferase